MHSRTDQDLTAVMDALRRVVRALRVSAHTAERGLGISGAQLFVLGEVAAAPGASLAELAARTATDPSSVSVVVARLRARKLLARRRHPDDARRAAIWLTARGHTALARAPEPVQVRLLAALRTLPTRRLRALADGLGSVASQLGLEGARPAMFFEEARRG
jgi:DNA-binding MarR family transcriptional regulator